jgi:hypothetical protein
MTTKRSESPFKHCNFAYSDGRCCSLPADPAFNGLCRSHGLPPKLPEPPRTDFNEDIFANFQPFTDNPPTEDQVHSALARVFMALAHNRITSKRAATFGYLGQLMLMKTGNRTNPETLNHLSSTITKRLHLTYNNPGPLNSVPAIPSEISLSPAPAPSPQAEPVITSTRSSSKRSA